MIVPIVPATSHNLQIRVGKLHGRVGPAALGGLVEKPLQTESSHHKHWLLVYVFLILDPLGPELTALQHALQRPDDRPGQSNPLIPFAYHRLGQGNAHHTSCRCLKASCKGTLAKIYICKCKLYLYTLCISQRPSSHVCSSAFCM